MKYILVIISILLLIPLASAVSTPVITSISPSSAYNVGVVTITISGAGFDVADVLLTKCGSGMVIGTITSESSTLITADFNIKNRLPGEASLRLKNKDGQLAIIPFIIIGDTTIPTTSIPQTQIQTYVTETPGYSTTTAEPDVTIVYIYNIPTPTYIVPVNQRGVAITTTPIPQQVSTIATTVSTPTPIKIVPTKTPKSSSEIIVIIISIFCIIYIIIKK
jgi:hypothetical protein